MILLAVESKIIQLFFEQDQKATQGSTMYTDTYVHQKLVIVQKMFIASKSLDTRCTPCFSFTN